MVVFSYQSESTVGGGGDPLWRLGFHGQLYSSRSRAHLHFLIIRRAPLKLEDITLPFPAKGSPLRSVRIEVLLYL